MLVMSMYLVPALLLGAGACAQPDLPTVQITRDNTVIDSSCRVSVPKDTFILDADGDGVIHIDADDITVEFVEGEGELIQVPKDTPWETIAGVGIRIDGHTNVTIRNAHSHRFKVGLWATKADGLTLENCDVSGGFAHKLGSTPQHEDGADWLWPHHNENHEWRDHYGAGICIEDSAGVTVSGCFARRRQNGLILDNVTNSRIFDNDLSFLSGWGIAMWRAKDNVISRNALDFCVRGYSHGVYNRGQDSAGILMFEDCDRNVVAENSVTHGGDGIFGFGGLAARGDDWVEAQRVSLRKKLGKDNVDDQIDPPADLVERTRRNGCDDNLVIANDLSYAAAHGFEMTFSFGNQFIDNRVVSNAICGVWGGYSQNTLIAGNLFESNGEYGYGMERGGVNIEHGYDNTIQDNEFRTNRCGVHLWWDPDPALTVGPWAEANNHPAQDHPDRVLPSYDNYIVDNAFNGCDLAINLRDTDRTVTSGNTFDGVAKVLEVTEGSAPLEIGMQTSWDRPSYEAPGTSTPTGARASLRGRDQIIMGTYFPWDHREPLIREVGQEKGKAIFEAFGFEQTPAVSTSPGVRVLVEPAGTRQAHRIIVEADPGVHPYNIVVEGDGAKTSFSGTLVNAQWSVTVFPWKIDPREDLDEWRALAQGDNARNATVDSLNLPYANAGPLDLLADQITSDLLGPDHFGTIARTRLALPAGQWRIVTNSDDGVRVTVDDDVIVDNWTWHAPERNEGILTLDQPRTVEIVVEHFEIDGYALLDFSIEPIGG